MPLGVAAVISDEEAAALERLRAQDEANGDNLPLEDEGTPAGEPSAPSSEPADAPPADTTDQTPAAPAPAAAAAPGDDKSKGDPARAALRASRAAERRAKDEAARLARENEELKKRLGATGAAPAQQESSDDITDDDIEEIAADFPKLGKVVKAMKKVVSASAPANPDASQAPAAEFVPVELDAVMQDAVDQIPDLSAWHNDPDQTRFHMVASMDGVLARHPKWSQVPLEQRLAEAVRRVNAELASEPSAPAARQPDNADVRAAIESAPMRTPRSASGIGGGSRGDVGNDLARFSSMDSDSVEAELATRG
jgi:hypothetical protein